jgi:hypothetical protein
VSASIRSLRPSITGQDAVWAKVLQEINDFNRLANAAGDG